MGIGRIVIPILLMRKQIKRSHLPKVLLATEPGVKPRQPGFKIWVLHPSVSVIASQLTTILLHYFLIQQIFTKCPLYDSYRDRCYSGWGLQSSKKKTPDIWHNNRGKIALKKLISKYQIANFF